MSTLQKASNRPCHNNGVDVDSVQPAMARPRKRTAESIVKLEQSPESPGDEDDREGGRIGVKRACNECRQQKASSRTLLPLIES